MTSLFFLLLFKWPADVCCKPGLSNPLDMMFHIQPWMILSLLPLSTAFEGKFCPNFIFQYSICVRYVLKSFNITPSNTTAGIV